MVPTAAMEDLAESLFLMVDSKSVLNKLLPPVVGPTKLRTILMAVATEDQEHCSTETRAD